MTTTIAIWTAIAIFGGMTLLWAISVAKRDSSIVDWLWAPGFALVGWTAFGVMGAVSPTGIVVLALISVWGLRLGGHLFLRNLREGEDPRYAAMRDRAGRRWWWSSLITVFWLQAALIWVISTPVQVAVGATAQDDIITWVTILGGVIAAAGLVIEGVADHQLKKFRASAAHKGVLDTGLWRYSRHPNYFGNALLWWGVWLIAAPLPDGLWTVFSPLIMTVLLVKVSGVPMLERTLMETKPDYAAYRARTSAFIPWFPARGDDVTSNGKGAPQRPCP